VVQTSQTTQTWVAAGRDRICMTTLTELAGSPGTCSTVAEASARGLFSWSHPAPDEAKVAGLTPSSADFSGLVPDGVDSVRIELADGSTVALTPSSNVVVAILRSRPVRERHTDGGGQTHMTEF
jgi:hypothetical protein